MIEATYLNNQFLIAMPGLADPHFSHTVTYLCQHNQDGALGIIINRPTGMKLGDIFEQMGIETDFKAVLDTPIFSGGPVQQERGFVIHPPCERQWDSSIPTAKDISLTSSKDILEAIAKGTGPDQFLIALGYAGWGGGQLEKEISENSWLNTPCGTSIIFETPVNKRWNAAADQIGIDISKLTAIAGHG